MLPVHTHRILRVLRNFRKLSQRVLLLSLSAGKYQVGFQIPVIGLAAPQHSPRSTHVGATFCHLVTCHNSMLVDSILGEG